MADLLGGPAPLAGARIAGLLEPFHGEQVAQYLVDQGRPGSQFEPRVRYPGRVHAALDVPGARGTEVYAVLDGVVIHAGRREGYGNLVLLRHPAPDDVTTAYAHLDSLRVEAGQSVRGGQVIGTMGNTCRGPTGSCGKVRPGMGVHLHFSVQRIPRGWTDARLARAFSSPYEERTDIRERPREWLANKGVAVFREFFAGRIDHQPSPSDALADGSPAAGAES